MELSEFMMKMFTVIILIFGTLGMVVQSASFEGSVETNELIRATLDLSQGTLSAHCLVHMKGGEIRKGMFEFDKLKKINIHNFCLNTDSIFYIKIKDVEDDDMWEIGNKLSVDSIHMTFPVSIRYDNKKINRGVLEMYVKEK